MSDTLKLHTLNLHNGLTAELFVSDKRKTRLLIKNCGPTVRRRWKQYVTEYVHIDDDYAESSDLLQDRLTVLVHLEKELVFLVMLPAWQDPVALQRQINCYGPSKLLEFTEFVAYAGRLYTMEHPNGKLIVNAVASNINPAIYALINKGRN
jgi:hypothetical protein